MPVQKKDPAGRRITVNLTRRAWDAKARLIQRGPAENITEAVSRSLVITDWLDDAYADGAEIVMHYPDGTQTRVVML